MLLRFCLILLLFLPSAAGADGLLWMVQEPDGIAGNLNVSGNWLSYRTIKGEAVLRRTDNGQVVRRIRSDDESRVFHRDQILYVASGDGQAKIFHPDERPPELLTHIKPQMLVNWYVASTELLYLDDSNAVTLVSLPGFERQARVVATADIRGVAIMSDGLLAAWTATDLYRWDRQGKSVETLSGRVVAADGGWLLLAGNGSCRLLPGELELSLQGNPGIRAMAGRVLIWAGAELLVVENNVVINRQTFPEEITTADLNGLKPLVLFRDWTVEEFHHQRFSRERHLEFGFGSDQIYSMNDGMILQRGGQIAACGRDGVRSVAPRESVERSGSVFGIAYTDLLSERWIFNGVSWSGNGAWLLAQRGDGHQHLLRFQGIGRPLLNLTRLETDVNRLCAVGLDCLLWKEGESGFFRWRQGSLETISTGISITEIQPFAGGLVGWDQEASRLFDLHNPGSKPMESVTAFTRWPQGGRELLGMRMEDGTREARLRIQDPDGKLVGEITLDGHGGLVAGSPGELGVVFQTGASGGRLDYRRLGMPGSRTISDFSGGGYRIDRLQVHPGGMLGLFTLAIPDHQHMLLGVFSPRGQIVRNVGLEEDLKGLDFAGSSTRIITVGRRGEMGRLRIYSLDGDRDDL